MSARWFDPPCKPTPPWLRLPKYLGHTHRSFRLRWRSRSPPSGGGGILTPPWRGYGGGKIPPPYGGGIPNWHPDSHPIWVSPWLIARIKSRISDTKDILARDFPSPFFGRFYPVGTFYPDLSTTFIPRALHCILENQLSSESPWDVVMRFSLASGVFFSKTGESPPWIKRRYEIPSPSG